MTEDNHTPQVDPEHYQRSSYNHRSRFLSYWNQVHQVTTCSPEAVLEIGVGNGFVSNFLRHHAGLSIHTVDFDARLEPDTVGDVRKLPFGDAQFDVVACFETLEHLPFDDFATSLRELARVSSRWVLLSLPDKTPYLRVRLEFGYKTRIINTFRDLPNPQPAPHEFDGEHHWEIGKQGYPLERIVKALEGAGLEVVQLDRDQEDPFHRFFRCKVR